MGAKGDHDRWPGVPEERAEGGGWEEGDRPQAPSARSLLVLLVLGLPALLLLDLGRRGGRAGTGHASVQQRGLLAYTVLLPPLENKEEEAQLHRVLRQMREHFLPWTPGRVLLFIAEAGSYSTPAQRAPILAIMPSAEFMAVPEEAWVLPEGLREEDVQSWAYAPCCPFPLHGVGYRHMCRWYSNGIFHHLAKLGFKWVLRLDTDSEVLSPTKTDIIAWMEANNKLYGYRLWDGPEDTEIIHSLPELTLWWLTANNLHPRYLFDSCRKNWGGRPALDSFGGWDKQIIYTNFFVASVDWWLSEQVQRYLRVVERANGYYLFRWGDALVHTMVVKAFLDLGQIHQFGFEYSHKGNHDAARRRYVPDMQEKPP